MSTIYNKNEILKMIHSLDDKTNQKSKYRIKTWIEINDNRKIRSCAADQIKFKTTIQKFLPKTMLKKVKVL